MNSWFQIVVEFPSSQVEAVSALVFDLGSSGLEEVQVSSLNTRLIVYFPSTIVQEAVVSALRLHLGGTARSVQVEAVVETDWSAAWRDHFEPVWPTERLVVCAPWHKVEAPPGGFRISIEPKMAFGTGGHATTRLALSGLEAIVKPGDRVLDVGTGSGVLAIASRLFGAVEVVALDTDPVATENVLENALANGVDGIRVETRALTAEDVGYRVGVANIISGILRPMLGNLHDAIVPGGHLILGGVLDHEEADFLRDIRNAGLRVLTVQREAEWVGFVTSRT